MTALLGIPILGEWPNATEWIAIISISAGVYVVSGGQLPHRTCGNGPPREYRIKTRISQMTAATYALREILEWRNG
jgi:hypothetical protein